MFAVHVTSVRCRSNVIMPPLASRT